MRPAASRVSRSTQPHMRKLQHQHLYLMGARRAQQQAQPPRSSSLPSPSPSPSGAIDFSDASTAFKSKSLFELLRSAIIFRICTFKPFVNNAEGLLKVSKSLLGEKITMGLLRHTFFAHFCAGEDEESIRPTVDKLRKYGVGGILDYAAEADIAEQPSNSPAQSSSSGGENKKYSQKEEDLCDAHRDIFLKCITAVHNVTPEGFAAVKLTALGNVELLRRMSAQLVEVQKLFGKFQEIAGASGTRLSKEAFVKGYTHFFDDATPEQVDTLFNTLRDKDGSIDLINWTGKLDFNAIAQLTPHCRVKGPLFNATLTDVERKLLAAFEARVMALANEAKRLQVRMMIDAEQSYFQPAIDHLVLGLQRRFNTDFPAILNTYQCYLKDSHQRVVQDLARAKREGYWFGAKLVRGAYMSGERKLAREQGKECPVHNTIEDTHNNYHKCVATVLEDMSKANVMIASHNQTSIEYTVKKMKEKGIDPHNGGVYFGQLLGMADHLTFTLAYHKYKAYKYVPYGPVNEVVPYLLRRAQENSDLLGGGGREASMATKELFRRLSGSSKRS